LFSVAARVAQAAPSITAPASGSTVSGLVSIVCTNSGGSTVGIYVDGNWVGGSPYSWNTASVSNGSHGLLCNGYADGSPNGSAGENIMVSNGGAPPSPGATPTPSSNTGACAPSVDVNCTGHKDSAALQTAMNCTGSVVRPHGICDVNVGLVGTSIGYDGTDATLNVESSVSTGVTLVTGQNAYGSLPWKGLRMSGSSNNSTGLLLAGNFTQVEEPAISGFTNNITIGNYAYLDTIITPTIWNGGAGIYCPSGTDSGEGINIVNGQIFNLGTGIYNAGCGFTIIGTHFDGISASPLVVVEGPNGAGIDCTNCYVEEFGAQPSGPMVSLTGYNGFGAFTWQGGSIGQDSYNNAPVLSLTNNGNATSAPYTKFINMAFKGVSLTGLSTNKNVALCGDTNLNGGGLLGNVPNSGPCP
jgi:hypothetical protein